MAWPRSTPSGLPPCWLESGERLRSLIARRLRLPLNYAVRHQNYYSMIKNTYRNPSYEEITRSDLLRLAQLAREDRESLFQRIPRWKKLYKDRLPCVALCQGTALHYLGRGDGIKDFDVWSFFVAHPEANLPPKRLAVRDFGNANLRKHRITSTLWGERWTSYCGQSIPMASTTPSQF